LLAKPLNRMKEFVSFSAAGGSTGFEKTSWYGITIGSWLNSSRIQNNKHGMFFGKICRIPFSKNKEKHYWNFPRCGGVKKNLFKKLGQKTTPKICEPETDPNRSPMQQTLERVAVFRKTGWVIAKNWIERIENEFCCRNLWIELRNTFVFGIRDGFETILGEQVTIGYSTKFIKNFIRISGEFFHKILQAKFLKNQWMIASESFPLVQGKNGIQKSFPKNLKKKLIAKIWAAETVPNRLGIGQTQRHVQEFHYVHGLIFGIGAGRYSMKHLRSFSALTSLAFTSLASRSVNLFKEFQKNYFQFIMSKIYAGSWHKKLQLTYHISDSIISIKFFIKKSFFSNNYMFLTLFPYHATPATPLLMTHDTPHLFSFGYVFPLSTFPRQNPNWNVMVERHSIIEIFYTISKMKTTVNYFHQRAVNAFENLMKHLFLSSACPTASSLLSLTIVSRLRISCNNSRLFFWSSSSGRSKSLWGFDNMEIKNSELCWHVNIMEIFEKINLSYSHSL